MIYANIVVLYSSFVAIGSAVPEKKMIFDLLTDAGDRLIDYFAV